MSALPEETCRVSEPRPVAVVVLAAGEGTRMKSRIPKVLHPLCGRSMLGHVLAAAGELDPHRMVVVAGHGRARAVRVVSEALGIMPGIVLVPSGDMPLRRAQTRAALAREHAAAGNA